MPIKWRFLVFLNYHLIAVSLKADRMTAQSGDHDCTQSIVVRSCCMTAQLSTFVQSSVCERS